MAQDFEENAGWHKQAQAALGLRA